MRKIIDTMDRAFNSRTWNLFVLIIGCLLLNLYTVKNGDPNWRMFFLVCVFFAVKNVVKAFDHE